MRLNITKYILLLLIITSSVLHSQNTDSLRLKGKVIESSTGKPVPFAGIYLYKTTIGTISDSLGSFSLNIPKGRINDTLIVSSIGYSRFRQKISDYKNLKKIEIYLNDSIYLLEEVVAIAYDYFETLKWQSKKRGVKAKYLTFSTNDIDNVSNFIKVMRSQFGKSKDKGSLYRWKSANIPNFGKDNRISLRFFACPYCPSDDDITVTIIIRDDKGRYPLNDENKSELLENFFQGLLDKTFDLGIDFPQLAKRNGVYYKKNSIEPYTGKCFGYFKNGQMGLKGFINEGYKTGEWSYWYSNSQQKMLVNYKRGKKTGGWKYWYDNGKQRIDANYLNGKMVGRNTWWFKNGVKKKISIYENGVFKAKIEWDSKGHVIEKIGKVE